MAYKLFAGDHHGMAGVVAPLKSNHQVGMFGQQVNYFTLAFVPPLGSDNYDICHNVISLIRRVQTWLNSLLVDLELLNNLP
jgi:hypothetical protein